MSETGILDTATLDDGDELVLIGYELDGAVVYEVRLSNTVVATEGELADAREQFWRRKHGVGGDGDGDQGIVATILNGLAGIAEKMGAATDYPGGDTTGGPTLPNFEREDSGDEGGSEPYIPGLDADEAPSLPQFEEQKEN